MWLNKQNELNWLDNYKVSGLHTEYKYLIVLKTYTDFSILFAYEDTIENFDRVNLKYRKIELTEDIFLKIKSHDYNFIEKEVKLLEIDIRKEKNDERFLNIRVYYVG